MENKNRVLLVFMFLWVVICFSSGEALAVSWNEANSGNWNEPTNWSGGVVPGDSDNVEITVDGTYTVTLDVDATIAGLTLGASVGTQTLAAAGRTLTISGASTINSNGVLSFDSSTLGGLGELTNQGTMSMYNSTINADLVNESSLTTSSACDINGAFSNESGGTLSLSSFSSLTVASGFTNQGAIEMNLGTLTGGGTLINQGSINTVGSGVSSLYMELDNQGTLTLDGGLTLNQPSATHTNSGTITVSGGNMVLTQSGTVPSFTNTGTIDIASGRSFTVNGGALNHNGTFTGSGTLSVSAGTFNLATNLSNLMTLSLTNTDLNGPGVLTNQGTMSVNNSTINAGLVNEDSLTVSSTCDINGAFSNASGGTLSMSSFSSLTVASGFTNQGAIEMNLGTLTGGGTLINQGSINTVGSGVSSLYMELVNQGTLTLDSGLTLNQPSAAHTNSGTITLSGGNLTLTQSGTDPSFTNTGTMDIASGRSFTVNGGALNHNGTFTGSGTLSVSAGTFNLATALSNQMTLSLSNSDLNGPGVLTNQGTMNMSNGTINADLVNEGALTASSICDINGPLSNESGGTLSLSSYSTLTVASGFTNNGNIELNYGTLAGGGTLINQGNINAVGSSNSRLYMELDNQGTLTLDSGLTLNQPSAAHTNSGTITVSGGNLTLTQTGTDPSFTNTGTMDIASGRSFTVNGGILHHNGTFTGSGTLSVSAGTLNLATALSNLMTLSLSNSELNGPGVLTNQGTMSMSNGTINADLVNEGALTASSICDINGALSNESGGTLSLSSYSTLTVASGFTNNGNIELNYGTLAGGGTLINQGNINTVGSSNSRLYMELDNQGTLTLDSGLTLNQPSAAHTNSGTITVSGGNLTLTQTGTDPSFTNTGTMDIASGRSFTVNGGILHHNGTFTGSGTLSVSSGTLNLATALSNLMTLSLSNSELNGPGVLTNQGTMSMSNGTINADLVNEGALTASSICDINGALSNASGGTLSLSSYSTLTVASGFTNNGNIELNYGTLAGGGTLINQGNINAVGSSNSRLYMELDNQGTLTLDSGLTLNQPSAAHTNSGTITVSGGNLTLTQTGTDPSFTNTGTIDIASGRSFTVNGGILHHNGTFTGSGTLSVSAGTLNLATSLSNQMTLSLSNSELNGPGVLTNQGTMSMSNGTINADLVNEGALTASSICDINGALSNASGGTLSLSSYSTLTVASGFTNNGNIELNYGTLAGGGTLINQGNINAVGSSNSRLYMELDNQGTLTLDSGLTLNQPSAAHTNSGTITVSGGNLTLTQTGTDPSFTNTGTIDIASGRSFTVNGGALENVTTGIIQGTGTLNVSGTSFTNAGTISPGTSPGILTVIGNCPQEYTAALNIEIGGLIAGTQYDRLDISGSAALAGTLNVTLINGFAPILDDTFPIVTYASHTGTFDTTNLPAPTDEVGWHIDYDATAIILSVISSTVIFTEDTLIDAGDTTYEGFHIVVGEGTDPVTLTINGTHAYGSMTITNLATLTHTETDAFTTRSLDLDITGDVDIEPGGEINVDGLGYLGGRQPGNEDNDYGRTSGNVTTNGSAGGAGASHGGFGGDGANGIIGSTYGDPVNPMEPGAGGGAWSSDDLGGNGGGLIRLVVDGTMTNDGIISANGLSPGDYTGGGGAGGGIYLEVDTLSGDGVISANGGSGGGTVEETGGGGGGRIAIWSNTYNFTGTLTASGGSGQNGGGDGEEGTACDMANPSIETISFDECISELCTSVITVDATDPCEGSLTYEWEALDGGSITGEGAEVEFYPPDTGPHSCPYQVKVTVTSDVSGLSAEETIDIYVKLAGDVDGDGVVNVLDKVQVRNHFGESGDPGWIDADVDCSGVVNVLDKVKVRNQFGQTGCECPE